MARRDWRLVSMWEGDPVGVDQKRPLVGFALVAVLCAVLMFVSVGRGFGLSDFVHPGRPISAPVEHTPSERPAGPARQDVPAAVPAAIPAELSAQPLAAVVAAASAEKAATEGSETSGQRLRRFRVVRHGRLRERFPGRSDDDSPPTTRAPTPAPRTTTDSSHDDRPRRRARRGEGPASRPSVRQPRPSARPSARQPRPQREGRARSGQGRARRGEGAAGRRA